MKKLLIIFLLLSGKIFSQLQPASSNEMRVAKYKKMKNNGIIMLCVGGPVLITGVSMYVSAILENAQREADYQHQMNAYQNQFTASNPYGTGITKPVQPDIVDLLPKIMGGVLLGVAGGLCVGGGTALFIIGKKKQKKWSEKVSFYIAPNAFKIAYKF